MVYPNSVSNFNEHNNNQIQIQIMPYRFAFMISLMFVLGCKSDVPSPEFKGNEATEFEKLSADFYVPEYKWGYINEEGKLAIADQYDDLREFSDGLAAFNKAGVWGFLDRSGNEVIPARYRTVQAFTEGIAVVEDLNKRFHLLDREGQTIADSIDLDGASKFQEGLSLINKGYLYGFMNKKGEVAIEPSYLYAKSFVDGMALVQVENDFGFIDQSNNAVIPIQYEKLWYPKDNMIKFKRDGKFGFIDLNTKKEIASGFSSATNFQGDYAVVNDGNNYLLIDKNANTQILPFSHVDTGGEGKWIYNAGSKFGFLKNDGEVLCLPQYDLLMRYRDGRAGFANNDIWGYLDEKGAIIIPAQYPLVWDFVNGYARMIGRYGFGFIDKNGNQFLPPQYMEVRDFSEGLARIQVYR